MTTIAHPSPPTPVPVGEPSGGTIDLVRWARTDGRGYRQRYFRRREAAHLFVRRLEHHGIRATTFRTAVDWWEVER